MYKGKEMIDDMTELMKKTMFDDIYNNLHPTGTIKNMLNKKENDVFNVGFKEILNRKKKEVSDAIKQIK